MVDHEKELEELNLKNAKALQEEQMHGNKREEKLKNELEFLKTSFHSYKVKKPLSLFRFFISNLFHLD